MAADEPDYEDDDDPRNVAEIAEDAIAKATARELADGIDGRWVSEPNRPGYSRLDTSERTAAFLHLRLTEALVDAIDRLTAASNSNTETVGRLTAVYVGLTGVIAAAALGNVVPQLADGLFVGSGVIVTSALLAATLAVTVMFVRRLWPKGPRGNNSRKPEVRA